IAESWEFSATASSYEEEGGTWDNQLDDDGWWLDDIRLTGALVSQVTPAPDTKAPLSGACPATCDPNVGDRGTTAALTIHDANGDGVFERGERLTLDASASSLPGGCVGGVAQFRFLRDGQVVQDWTTNNAFIDAPLVDAGYQLLVRCSADFQCSGTVGVSAMASVYSGDGADISVLLTHASAGASSLAWPARPQPTSVIGYDVFRGTITIATPGGGDPTYATLTCLRPDVPQQALGTTVSVLDGAVPATGQGFYYLVGHSAVAPGALDALGKKSNGTIVVAPLVCP
ncbi:MAG: hypothetical protein AAB297_02240, partial [Acidobacteriota bacterium]